MYEYLEAPFKFQPDRWQNDYQYLMISDKVIGATFRYLHRVAERNHDHFSSD